MVFLVLQFIYGENGAHPVVHGSLFKNTSKTWRGLVTVKLRMMHV